MTMVAAAETRQSDSRNTFVCVCIEENTNISEGGVLRHTRVIQTRIESGTMMMMILVMIDGERKRLGIVLVQGEVSVEENDPGLLLIIQTIVEDRKCVLLS